MARRVRFYIGYGLMALFALSGCATFDGNRDGSRKITADPKMSAQVALDRGLAAAKQQDWKTAVGYFTAAQQRASLWPIAMFNLGLAHAKAGDELLASMWLRAYLAAMPDAANGEAVRTEIKRLEGVVETKIARLFQYAIALAEQLPVERASSSDSKGRRHEALDRIAYYQFRIGDFDGGKSTLQRAAQAALTARDRDNYSHESALYSHGMFLAEARDVEGAKAILNRFKDASYSYKQISQEIAKAKIEANIESGNIDAAARELSASDNHFWSKHLIIQAYAKRGEFPKAEAVASTWDDFINIAEQAIHQGNLEQARSLAHRALRLSPGNTYSSVILGDSTTALNRLRNEEIKSWGGNLNERQAQDITGLFLVLGDISSARKAAGLAKHWAPTAGNGSVFALKAEAYVLAADGRIGPLIEKVDETVAAARAYDAKNYANTFVSDEIRRDIGHLAIRIRNLNAAEKIVDRIERDSIQMDVLRLIRDAHEKRGDSATAVRLRQRIDQLDAASRMGWVANTSDQVRAVKIWIDSAHRIAANKRVADFQKYLDVIKRVDRPDWAPIDLCVAAEQTAQELRKVRVLGAR